MKKLLVVVFLIVSMTGVAHADQAAASAAYQSCMATCAGPVNGVACGDQCTAAYNAQGGANPATVSQQQHGSGAPSSFTALAPIPGLTDANTTSVINSTTLANFFNNLYKYLIGLAAVIAVIEIIWGGLEISTKDSVSKQSDGKERITQAIFGLVLVLSPVLVFSIINPSILNLSLDLPPLDTVSSTTYSGGATQILQDTTNYENPAGTLASCSNNDCTGAQTECQNQNGPGYTAEAVIVCVKGGQVLGGMVSPVVGSSGVCPDQTTKAVECITTASNIP